MKEKTLFIERINQENIIEKRYKFINHEGYKTKTTLTTHQSLTQKHLFLLFFDQEPSVNSLSLQNRTVAACLLCEILFLEQ